MSRKSPRIRVAVEFASIMIVAGCGGASVSRTANVFGQDHRQTPPDTAPFTAVGRFDSGCSGTLIGRRLMLTAAHCIVDSSTAKVQDSVGFFRPDLRGGHAQEALWAKAAWIGTMKPEDQRLADWAIVELEDVRGLYGALPVMPQDLGSVMPYQTNLVGYSSDRNNGDDPSAHMGCFVEKIVDGKLFHACDGTAGVSGGPLIDLIGGQWGIVGMTVSEYRQGAPSSVFRDGYSDDYANVAVPAGQFAEAANALIQTIEAGGQAPTLPGVTFLANPNRRPPGLGLAPRQDLVQRQGEINQALQIMADQAAALANLGRTYQIGALADGGQSCSNAMAELGSSFSGYVGSGAPPSGNPTTTIYARYFAVDDDFHGLAGVGPLSSGLAAEANLYLQRAANAEAQLVGLLFY
jgi:protease YdgD